MNQSSRERIMRLNAKLSELRKVVRLLMADRKNPQNLHETIIKDLKMRVRSRTCKWNNAYEIADALRSEGVLKAIIEFLEQKEIPQFIKEAA
ncbi:MAG: hypothetical protein JXA71_19545 [Chitinispirillaceae bacterium]|nr:hypothetical protein [Chitinispirillaceae bacterium]